MRAVAFGLFWAVLVGSAQKTDDASELVRQLRQFPAAIDPGIQSDSGLPKPVEQQRTDIYAKLRTLADQAVPALQHGLTDADLQVMRNVALYLWAQGAASVKPAPLNLKPFLAQLVVALRDDDERVKELAAQALEHVGSDGVIAVPDLIRMLRDPSEGLRNTACIGLAGIGPAAHDALPALRRAVLFDPSSDVRRFAQRAIDKIAPKRD